MNEQLEFAILADERGHPYVNSEAHASFRRAKEALRLAGGTPPMDARGRSMLWRENLETGESGWVTRDAPPGATGSLREKADRLRQIERRITDETIQDLIRRA